MTDVLLVPSAILVPDELRLDLGRIPTGMIPLHGKPVLHHLIDSFDDVLPYIACHRRTDTIKEYLRREELAWRLLELPETHSIGETVQRSIEKITADQSLNSDTQLYVNFADTLVIPNQPTEYSDFISYATERNPIRWTSFEADGRLSSIRPKLDPRATGTHNVFTGLFRFSDPEDFFDSLTQSFDTETTETDPFYLALLDYLQDREHLLLEADEWIDVGHLDTYFQAKKQFLNVRNFNSVDPNGDPNRITKSSDNAETLRAEYAWYSQLPEELKPFIPTIYDFDETVPRIELEFIGYPSLRDLYLHGSHGLHIWNQIYDTLFAMLDDFARYRTSEHINSSLEAMYLQKTRRRLEAVDQTSELRAFFGDSVTINGRTYDGIPVILDRLEPALEVCGVLEGKTLVVIHGDLCFSNIFFDPRNGIVKLIDPRGSFGPHVVYGDQRYDLAKLRHSVAGSYDFIINDMFSTSVDGSTATYQVYRTGEHEDRTELFDSRLRQKYPDWFKQIKFIEGLLFLSMVPIHDDSISRQQYMLSRGIELFHAGVDR